MEDSVVEPVKVSMDPYVLDLTLGKRQLKAIELDGGLSYEESKSPNVKLTEELERIWNEYPNGLLDLTEEQLKLPDVPAKQDAVEDSKTSHEEMESMRLEVYDQLNNARNELWFALELAKTLSQSTTSTIQPPPDPTLPPKKGKVKTGKEDSKQATTKGDDAPILPPGTFSTTPSVNPPRRLDLDVYEMELALAAKKQALDDCSALIDAAVEELQMMAAGGNKFWDNARTLHEGQRGRNQWALVPKPDFGRTGEKAQDIVIPYAVDEASSALRARSLAAFDLDPNKDALTFGARTFLRLRVKIGQEVSSEDIGAEGIGKQMEAVQMEAFDEDLFSEIRAEASRFAAIVETRSVTIKSGEENICYEMVDVRETDSKKVSPICDLLLSSARISMLRSQRQRKARLIGQALRRIPIITPSLHLLQYATSSKRVDKALESLVNTLTNVGLSAAVVKRWSLEAGVDFLVGDEDHEAFGCAINLEIQGCPGIRIDTSTTSITFTSSTATFAVTDLSELPYILSDEIVSQLLSYLGKRAVDANQDEREVFLDEIEGGINIGHGIIGLSLAPGSGILYASYRSFSGDEKDTFESGSGISLVDWVDQKVAQMRAAERSHPPSY